MIRFLKSIPAVLLFVLAVLAGSYTGPGHAQQVFIPNYWDENERFSKPDLKQLPRLRFLTTTDFPPFNFIDRKKRLSGLHVDLARAICAELEILNRCEIQALPWEELEKALEKGEGEAIIAGHEATSKTRERLEFSRAYLQIPGRFVTLKDSGLQAPAYDALFRKNTGVVAKSAHEKYFADIFATRGAVSFDTREAALAALLKKEVDAVFSDALSLSFWIKSAAAKDCCRFLDGAFESQQHFGTGMSVALPKGRQDLVDAMNYALSQVNRKGKFAELYLRYFPVGLY